MRSYYLCRASLLVCQAFSALLLRLHFSGFKDVVWEIETLPTINQYSSTKKKKKKTEVTWLTFERAVHPEILMAAVHLRTSSNWYIGP